MSEPLLGVAQAKPQPRGRSPESSPEAPARPSAQRSSPLVSRHSSAGGGELSEERFIEQNTLDAAEYLDCAGRHSLRECKKKSACCARFRKPIRNAESASRKSIWDAPTGSG